jgi:hypothetical protein
MFSSFCPNEVCERRNTVAARRRFNLIWIALYRLDATKGQEVAGINSS